MRKLLPFLFFFQTALAQDHDSPDPSVVHEYVIPSFRTESGVLLPAAHVVYGTYGHLNAAHNNVVLLPSHYMATHRGYEWLMGPGKALDTAKLFLVCTELFGNGHSSSPSNTPEPLHGPRFPIMTIRDNVEAVHRLLVDELKIRHLRAIIGFSMGAQQAFQWAVSYPVFADRIVATSGTAKTYGHGVVRLEGQISAITADSAFNGGDYKAEPARGLSAFGMVWAGWLYSQEWWRKELWRVGAPTGTTFAMVLDQFRTSFIPGADATPGFNGDVEKALGSIRVPFIYMPSETDLYFPLGDAEYEKGFMTTVVFKPIPSLWGHTAGAAPNEEDGKFLNDNIGMFLQK